VSPVPADIEPDPDQPEPRIRLLPSAFTATAGGEPASPEAAYRAILETAIDAIITIDVPGRIVAHNAAACRMFGYGSDDLLGAHMGNLVPAPDRAALVSTITTYVADTARGSAGGGLEMDALHADGHVFPVHLAIGGTGRGAHRLFTIIVRDRSAERAAAVTRAATEREREAFQRVTEAAATGIDAERLFHLVAAEVADVLHAPACIVARFDGARSGVIVGTHNILSAPALAIGDTIDLTLDGAMTRARDAQDVVRMTPEHAHTVAIPFFGERAAAPLRVAGVVWGALVAAAGPGEQLDEDADRQLRRVAQVIEVAVAESTAREALAARAAQQTVVAELGRCATEGVDVMELFQRACDGVREAMPADITAVMQTQGSDDIAVHAASGTPEPLEPGHRISRADAPITVAAVGQAEPTLIADTGTLGEPAPIVEENGIRTVLAVPIRLRAEVFGVIVGTRLSDRAFTHDDRAFLQSIANVLGAAIVRARDEEAMRRAALHDPLTGLPNRTLLLDRLATALARCPQGAPRVAVLTCDFDGFARINEEAGHTVGDEVLRAAAERIAALLEPRDTLARASGDEFVVIREDADGPGDAGALGQALLDALSEPYELDGRVLPAVSASVGIALRGRGDEAEVALRDADTAAHRANGRARGRLEIFDESMREGLLARLALESDLRRMVHARELRLHYMPLVSLEEGSIDGFEALVRWEHPVRGLLAPGEFIDTAEHTGAIRDIGRWVIAQACHDASVFQRAVTDGRRLRMSVNLSPRQLADPGLVDHVAASLAEADLPPASLALEITETVLLDEDPVHHERLTALRALGVGIVLDDFGTGYSSLGYLRGLPLDGLKLDRSFVAGLGSDDRSTTIVAAVTQLAHALGLPVTAEGVETAAQVVSLQTLGCQYGQGFLFSRPVPRAAAYALLAR
jgi:diguanylate cyclase (GGDEF)-like protein/PAS domain S-box-containing protein